MQAPGGSKDFKAPLSSVNAKNVDMIYMPIYYTEGALIAVQAKQLGLKVPLVLLVAVPELGGYKDAFAFMFLILFLLFRPVGIMGDERLERSRF